MTAPADPRGALANMTRAAQQFISSTLTERPDTMYRLDDYPAMRRLLFDNVLDAVTRRFPLRNDRYTLGLEDVGYDDPEDIDVDEQKDLLMEGKSSVRRLRGSWVLRDAVTDRPLSRTRRMTLMGVPRMTDRGTFIKNGREYCFSSIMRLEPGVYCKQKPDEVSAQFNIRKGTGSGFSLTLNPATGAFRVRRGTANAPAYTVLHDMGVTDDQMRQAWGDEVFAVNCRDGQGDRARKAADRIYGM